MVSIFMCIQFRDEFEFRKQPNLQKLVKIMFSCNYWIWQLSKQFLILKIFKITGSIVWGFNTDANSLDL